MKFQLLARPLVAALLPVLGILAISCGDGNEPTSPEQQYFSRLESISDSAFERWVKATEGPAFEEDDPLDRRISALQERYAEAVEIHEDAIQSLEELNPPARARDAHDDLVAGLRGTLPLYRELSRQAADIESESDIADFPAITEGEVNEKYEAANERSKAACLDLQRIADDGDIDLEFDSLFFPVVC